MGKFHLPVCFIVFCLGHLQRSHGQAANTTGYSCDATSSLYPCETYVFYRATSPNFLDLASIGDLFHVSRLMIAEPSNISTPTAPLSPNQQLLVPITCSCNPLPNSTRNYISYANLTYTIKSGDTFYLVSTISFLNLTTFQSVEAVNPSLVPTNLSIGQSVIFPVFCRCPNRTENRTNFLISYVYQQSDNLTSVASLFETQPQSIVESNRNDVVAYDTIFVPVSGLPSWRQPTANAPAEAPSQVTAVTQTVDRKGVVTGLAIGLGICGVTMILIISAWVWRERSGVYKKDRETSMENRKWKRNYKAVPDANMIMDVSGCLDKYRVFAIDELEEATHGFSEESLVGGSVYKGWINGEAYAIKMMTWDARDELKILQKVNHGSLVKLEGFCIDADDSGCYLVYEYVENGSLYTWLQGRRLSWKTRVIIAVDVANGLQYIHEHTRPRVVHKDLRSSNVLLDANLRGKIANFGLAKSGHNAITKHIVGTQGYMAPEYLIDGVVSTKMDVFAFGVVLLELVSGRKPVDEEGRLLWAVALEELGPESGKGERVREWTDAVLEEEFPMESVMNVVGVAMACLQRDPEKRPNMAEIVYALCRADELPFSFDDASNEGLLSGPIDVATAR